MIDFARIWEAEVNQGRGSRANAFRDPLEGAEWRGLTGALRLFGYGERRKVAGRSAKPAAGHIFSRATGWA